MTQKEFSEKTGIPQSTISDWKGKDLNPAVDKIMIICNVLDMTPNELLSTSLDTEKYKCPDSFVVEKDSAEYEIVQEFRQLDDARKERIMGYLKALRDL